METERRRQSKNGDRSRNHNLCAAAFLFQLQLVFGTAVFFGGDAWTGLHALAESYELDLPGIGRILRSTALCTALACSGFMILATRISTRVTPYSFVSVPVAIAIAGSILCCNTRENRSSWELEALFAELTGMASILFIGLAYLCRREITFSTATFQVGSTIVKQQPGLIRSSWILLFLYNIWSVLWLIAFVGVYFWCQNQTQQSTFGRSLNARPTANATRNMNCLNSVYQESTYFHSQSRNENCREQISDAFRCHPAVSLAFLFSLHWTYHTAKHWVQVSTSSRMRRWWIQEETKNYTYNQQPSLGSVALDSLYIPLSQFIGLPCTNSWTFLFMGWYGGEMDFISLENRGKRAFEGWAPLRQDASISTVLALCNLGIAVSSACAATTVDAMIGPAFVNLEPEVSLAISFAVAFIVGWVVGSSVLVFFDAMARSTVLSIADSFPEGDLRRTRLAFQLKNSWERVYPGIWTETNTID